MKRIIAGILFMSICSSARAMHQEVLATIKTLRHSGTFRDLRKYVDAYVLTKQEYAKVDPTNYQPSLEDIRAITKKRAIGIIDRACEQNILSNTSPEFIELLKEVNEADLFGRAIGIRMMAPKEFKKLSRPKTYKKQREKWIKILKKLGAYTYQALEENHLLEKCTAAGISKEEYVSQFVATKTIEFRKVYNN